MATQLLYDAGLHGVQPQGVFYQWSPAALVEAAIRRGEGVLSDTGALVVRTGKYTGRSPHDRFVVDGPTVHDQIDWGEVNHPLSRDVYQRILAKVNAYLNNRDVYVFDGYAGADPTYALPVRFVTELASHNLFVHQLFIRPTAEQLEQFVPGFSVVCVPGLNLDPEEDGVHSEAGIIVNLETKMVLIVATAYAGEMKKSIFSVMNYLMPERDVFPMHCSANVGADGATALFFGLSGTGKTTLSADPQRTLIGDDEHGWSPQGIFNFEGGCYAKTIRLSAENEPEIYQAIRFGALVENVVIDEKTRQPDYDDGQLTENTRVGYPIHYIPNASPTGTGKHPKTILFLTADAFGVLPAVSKLTPEQAQYHFISGYTSKLAGTERGIKEPQATFSTCFGAPFMPRPSAEYAELLTRRIEEHQVNVYLINTGWQGGAYGVGKRIAIPETRAMVTAALNGDLEKSEYWLHPVFNVLVPRTCPGVPSERLNPEASWSNKEAYTTAARHLAKLFVENFQKFRGVDHLVFAGPRPQASLQNGETLVSVL
ncbi:MAG: phosphoenolpyruvate carboxykinase (ATP) [Candidatus Melainabacteria bacterium]|nr:phosphoenolpyruvate carboxykinase (ATP) [Candidatus Melainabacteria bacterium]